jgi:hypothetical protein
LRGKRGDATVSGRFPIDRLAQTEGRALAYKGRRRRAVRLPWDERRESVRKILVLALVALVGGALAVAGVAQASHHGSIKGKAAVTITQVIDNPATGCVTLKIDLKGWKLYPGQIGASTNQPDGGHFHVYVNGQYWTVGANPHRARACGLEHGKTYQMQVVLAYNNHTEIAARSRVVSAILP